jgi:hypothetical protein
MPIRQNVECHGTQRATGRITRHATTQQPLLVRVRIRIVLHCVFEQSALQGHADGIGSRVSFTSSPPSFRGVESVEKLATEFGGTHDR